MSSEKLHLERVSRAVPYLFTVTLANLCIDVQNFFHALALHENRKPFVPTLAHIPEGCSRKCNFKQVWFSGSHHDLGKEGHVDGGGLPTLPLAWMVSKLFEIGVLFNEAALKSRFPLYGQEIPIHELGRKCPSWLRDSVHQSKSGIWRLTGHQQRTPGQYAIPGMQTNEAIHHSVSKRLRNFGGTALNEAVPGYTYVSSPERANTWIQVGSWESHSKGSRDRRVLIEAPIAAFEAKLLGLKLPVVEPPAGLSEESGPTLHAQAEPHPESSAEAILEPGVRPATDGRALIQDSSGFSQLSVTEETEEPTREP